MVHLLEQLKVVQDRDDAVFLSSDIDKIISQFEKLKEVDSTFMELYQKYKEEGFFESTI